MAERRLVCCGGNAALPSAPPRGAELSATGHEFKKVDDEGTKPALFSSNYPAAGEGDDQVASCRSRGNGNNNSTAFPNALEKI